MKKKVIIAIAAVVVIGTVLIVRHLRNNQRSGTLDLSGTIEVTETNIGFKMPGRVTELLVEEGQRVAKETRLSSLENSEIRNIVEQNRAAVRLAEADLAKATKDIERYRPLEQEGVITTQQLDGATRSYAVARSQVDQARAALRAAEVRLSDTVLDAPLTGVVLSKNVELGETVAAGEPVYSLGDLADPWVKVYVNETKLGMVKLGQHARVSVDTYPGKVYEGQVTYIASEAEFTPKNVQTQEERVKLVFGVKVSVKNVDDELKPGMPADVQILLK
jgi:HlyD family secretion protein